MAGFLIHEESKVAVYWMEKSGCTLLKNLFYRLSHGISYPDAIGIHHDASAFVGIKYRPEKHRLDARCSFVVARDPVARICSFYWDKIDSRGPNSLPRVRKVLSQLGKRDHPAFPGFASVRGATLYGHRWMFEVMLDAIGHAFSDEEGKFTNGHFARQSDMIAAGGASELPVVTLENLHDDIPQEVTDRLPNIVPILKEMPRMNESTKQFSVEELITPHLRKRILKLYPRDAEMHAKALASPVYA